MWDESPDYDTLEKEMWRGNASQVKQRLSDVIELEKWKQVSKEQPGKPKIPDHLRDANKDAILKRIQLYSDRFGYELGEITNKIFNDQMFAAHFAVEPRRQGIHEQIAGEWIKQLSTVSDFGVLPKSGKNAWYVSGDGVVGRALAGAPSKSLDFVWKTGAITCYAMHKYTKEGGGNQDSQRKEMLALLQNFYKCQDTTCALFVIVDGPYYTKDRLKVLRNNIRTIPPLSYALPIGQVPEILAEISDDKITT